MVPGNSMDCVFFGHDRGSGFQVPKKIGSAATLHATFPPASLAAIFQPGPGVFRFFSPGHRFAATDTDLAGHVAFVHSSETFQASQSVGSMVHNSGRPTLQ